MRLFWLNASIIFLLDRITKYLILKAEFEKIKILPILDIVKVWNRGIAFGIFSKPRTFAILILILITGIVLVFAYIWAKKISSRTPEDKISLTALGMLFGGGMGNFADRILFGEVLDFLDLHINSFHWPAFNLADVAITFSLFLLFYKTFKK